MAESKAPLLPPYDCEDGEEGTRRHYTPRTAGSAIWLCLLTIISAISLTANVLQSIQFNRALSDPSCNSCKLPLSGLSADVDKAYLPTEFASTTDMEALDSFWYSLDPWVGVVALPKDLHFGSSYSFPWDEGKNVYNLNAFHNLHCLQMIYRNIRELQQGIVSNTSFQHSRHCLDVLRSDTICVADDTPISFEFDSSVKRTETPPKRKCRDWGKMVSFARENSACFRKLPLSDPRWSTKEAFTYCPEGSPYIETIDEHTSSLRAHERQGNGFED